MIDKWFQTLKVQGIRYILCHTTITISKVQGPIIRIPSNKEPSRGAMSKM
jgi:hypothetical protein